MTNIITKYTTANLIDEKYDHPLNENTNNQI